MQLSLGTAQLGVDYGVNNAVGYLSDDQADAVLEAAADSGFTMADVSVEYGAATERIGHFLRRRPGTLDVVVKVHAGLTKRAIRKLQNQCRELIGTVHYYMLWTSDQEIGAIDPWLAEGISVNTVEEAEAVGSTFGVIQVPASVLDGRMDATITRLQKKGKIVQVRSLLLQGLLAADPETGPAREHRLTALTDAARPYLQTLRYLALTYNMSVVELAVRWVWQINPDVAIIGAETPEQVRAIAEAWKHGVLPEKLVEQLLEAREGVPDLVISPRMWGQSFAFTMAGSDAS